MNNKESFKESLIDSMLENIRLLAPRNTKNTAYLISGIDYPKISVIETSNLDEGINILKKHIKAWIKQNSLSF